MKKLLHFLAFICLISACTITTEQKNNVTTIHLKSLANGVDSIYIILYANG